MEYQIPHYYSKAIKTKSIEKSYVISHTTLCYLFNCPQGWCCPNRFNPLNLSSGDPAMSIIEYHKRYGWQTTANIISLWQQVKRLSPFPPGIQPDSQTHPNDTTCGCKNHNQRIYIAPPTLPSAALYENFLLSLKQKLILQKEVDETPRFQRGDS